MNNADFPTTNKNEGEEVYADQLRCTECGGVFYVEAGVNPDECPFCETEFDGEA